MMGLYCDNGDFNKNYFSIDELYDAYLECRKGKKSMNVLKFEVNVEENLFKLLYDLNNKTYQISRALCFVVIKPKIREIWACDFRDRIVHHLITRKIEVFYENFNKIYSFLDCSYANRKNLGTHAAVKKLKFLIKHNDYFLKLDIESFFNSIDRKILINILNDDLKCVNFKNKNMILDLFEKIIFHNYTKNYVKKSSLKLFKLVPYNKSLFSSEPLKKGLPIGNLTSQFLSNVYLNKLDYFIENSLGFKNYIRYVDDFIILSNDKFELEMLINKISLFLEKELKIKLHPNKIVLDNVVAGIDFLGYYIKPNYSLVRKRIVSNLKNKIHNNLYDLRNNKKRLTYCEVESLLNIVNSYFGHFKHSNSYNLKLKMVKKLNEYFDLKKKNGSLILKHRVDLNFKNVMAQYNYFKDKFRNHLIVFHMGNFYRFFDEQAEFVSKELKLKTQIKKYSGKNYLVCGFPLNSKKINEIKNLDINFVIIKQLQKELLSGLKERIEIKVVSNKKKLILQGGFRDESEDINSILTWNLNSMTPMEVFTKLIKIQKNQKQIKIIKNEKN